MACELCGLGVRTVLNVRLSVALDYYLAHAAASEAFIIVPSIDGTGPEENQWHWRNVNGPVRPEGGGCK